MPTNPSNGYAWRGRRACTCVIDATADYERLTKSSLTLFQACYSNASASANTHAGGGAIDTYPVSDRGIRTASAMGYWPSNRYRWQGFIEHAHWCLFGCPHQSSSLSRQEDALRAGKGGLASGARDLFEHLRPDRIVTYAQWKAEHNKPAPLPPKYIKVSSTGAKLLDRKVTSKGINAARRAKKSSIHSYWCQVWLRRLGYYPSVIDAKWGPVTEAARYNFCRKALGWSHEDSTGSVGIRFLVELAKKAKTTHQIGAK